MSCPRLVRQRMKSRVTGDMVRRDEYEERNLGAKVELVRRSIRLGLMRAHELPGQELRALIGPPRARNIRGEIPLRSYGLMHDSDGEVDPVLLRRVLCGISCRNHETAAEAIPGAAGLSPSTLLQASARTAQCHPARTENRGRGAGKREGGVINTWSRGRQQLGMGLIRAP